MEKLALVGYYGMSNFGDDLFGFVGANAAREYWKNQECFIVSAPIKGVKAEFSLKSEKLSELYSKHTIPGKITRLANSVCAAFVADHYVYCGGSMFSNGSDGNRLFADRVAGGKISGIGVSVGPFASTAAEKKTVSLLKRMQYLALRDTRSYDFVTTLNLDIPVVKAADLAGLTHRYFKTDYRKDVASISREIIEKRERLIGLTLCNYKSDKREQLEFCKNFIAAVKKLPDWKEVTVLVINLNSHKISGDDQLSADAAAMLISNEVKIKRYSHGNGGVEVTLNRIAGLDAYVSARLHGVIAAYLFGVPFIVHGHHRKLIDFAEDVCLQAEFVYVPSESSAINLAEVLVQKQTPESRFSRFAKAATMNFLKAPWQ